VGSSFGLLGYVTERHLTEDWRKNTIAEVNKAAGTWNSYPIYAEECMKALAGGNKVKIGNAKIGEAGEIPGMESLRKIDPDPFKEHEHFGNQDYTKAFLSFRDTELSLQKYIKDHPQIKSDWFLEIYGNNWFTFNSVEYGVSLKLSDAKNKIIAKSVYGSQEEFSDTLNGYNFIDIKNIIRENAKKACTKALQDMGLI
jgi:hypothetical protein